VTFVTLFFLFFLCSCLGLEPVYNKVELLMASNYKILNDKIYNGYFTSHQHADSQISPACWHTRPEQFNMGHLVDCASSSCISNTVCQLFCLLLHHESKKQDIVLLPILSPNIDLIKIPAHVKHVNTLLCEIFAILVLKDCID